MKTVLRLVSAGLALTLLAGCGAGTPPADSGNDAPAGEEVRGVSLIDVLQPSADYGPLTIFSRPTRSADYPYYTYGLLDSQGQVVLAPVLSSLWEQQYRDGQGNSINTGILRLGQECGSEENPWLEKAAFAARDGSWVTSFDYWGGIAFPGGVAATSDEGISLLDSESGTCYRNWTWEELGQTGPEALPCVGGDVYSTAQWMDGRLQIGEAEREGRRVMLMLDPDTGKVEEITTEEWVALCDQVYGG